MATKFYLFRQNNSGGWFVENDGLSIYTIVEAHSPDEANLFAESLGVYFDGCSTERDCSCCGDRWEEADDYSAYDTPEDASFSAYRPDSVRIHRLPAEVSA